MSCTIEACTKTILIERNIVKLILVRNLHKKIRMKFWINFHELHNTSTFDFLVGFKILYRVKEIFMRKPSNWV